MIQPITPLRPLALPAPDSVGDAELVTRAAAGDRFACELIYRRHARYLTGLTVRLLANRHEAEEVVQDTFIRAFGRLPSLREPSALRAWLTQIAVSLAGRRLRRARLTRLLGLAPRADDAALGDIAAAGLGADSAAELALLDRALRLLNPELKLAWMLRRVDGMDLGEVAATCNCSLATAKRRISKADQHVGKHLGTAIVEPVEGRAPNARGKEVQP